MQYPMKSSLLIFGMVFSMTTTACDSGRIEPPDSISSVEESLKVTEGAIEVLASVPDDGGPPSPEDIQRDVAQITEQLERMSLERERVHEEVGPKAASDLIANHVQANLLLRKARGHSEAVGRYLSAEEPDIQMAAYRWKKRLRLKALAEDLR